MNLFWFYIIISIAVTGLIAMLFIEFPIRRRVKAGKADKYVFCRTVTRRLPHSITVDKQCIDTSNFLQMVAAGDSMKDYKINDGNNILVAPYDKFSKSNIDSYPVIAIKMHGFHLPFDSKLKLRKFVGYVGDEDWGSAYDKYCSRVKESVGREDFIASCSKSYHKHPFKLSSPKSAILSETYDVISHCYHYSVHPVGSVYGKVVFVGK